MPHDSKALKNQEAFYEKPVEKYLGIGIASLCIAYFAVATIQVINEHWSKPEISQETKERLGVANDSKAYAPVSRPQ